MNRYLIVFGSLILMSLGLFLTIYIKLVPFDFSHTLYYCQAVISSLTLKLPHELRLILGFSFLASLFWSLVNITVFILHTFFYKKSLQEVSLTGKSISQVIRTLGLDDKVVLIQHKKPLAFCLGIFKPKIYLSTALLNLMTERELTAILLHEKYHLQKRHPLTSALTTLAVTLMPFLPIIKDLAHQYDLDKELAADYAVVKNLKNPVPLLSALKKLLQQPAPLMMFATNLLNSPTSLETRINRLLKTGNNQLGFSKLRLFVSIISISVLAAVALTPTMAMEPQSGNGEFLICSQKSDCAFPCTQISPTHIQTPTHYSPVSP